MSESVKGFSAVAVAPNQIRVNWDWITQEDFEGVKIVWWCIGESIAESSGLIRYASQFSIPTKPGKGYVVAAMAYFTLHYPTSWVFGVVKMPQKEEARCNCWLLLAEYLTQNTRSTNDVAKRIARLVGGN